MQLPQTVPIASPSYPVFASTLRDLESEWEAQLASCEADALCCLLVTSLAYCRHGCGPGRGRFSAIGEDGPLGSSPSLGHRQEAALFCASSGNWEGVLHGAS